MRGLDPRIHVFFRTRRKTWMAGSSPAMTRREITHYIVIPDGAQRRSGISRD
jgi:hypothetical protein